VNDGVRYVENDSPQGVRALRLWVSGTSKALGTFVACLQR